MSAPERWLCRLELPHAIWYLSEVDAAPVDATGATVAHVPTLSRPQVNYSALPGTESAVGEFNATVEFLIPSSLAVAEACGAPIALGRATLLRWTEGTPYEAAEAIAAGDVVIDGLPLAGEAVSVSLEAPDPARTGAWPPSDAAVVKGNLVGTVLPSTALTLVPADNVLGLLYIWVFGRPGMHYVDGAVEYVPATPAILVNLTPGIQRVQIAGHSVAATSVDIYANAAYDGASLTDTFVPEQFRDTRQRITTIANVSARAISWEVSDSSADLYVSNWSGGSMKWDDGEEIRGLGEVCLYLLRAVDGGSVHDLGAWQSLLGQLNRIEVGGFIDESVEPWEVIAGELRPLFPRLSVMWAPLGYRPVVFEDADSELTPELVEDVHFALVDGTRPADKTEGGYTTVRIEYSHNLPADLYLDSITVGPGYRGAVGELPSELGRRAYTWQETAETWTHTTPWLWLHDSAAVVAREWSDLLMEPLPGIEVLMLDPLMRRALPVGAAVRVTSTTISDSAGHGWAARPCWVSGHRFDGDQFYVILLARPRRL